MNSQKKKMNQTQKIAQMVSMIEDWQTSYSLHTTIFVNMAKEFYDEHIASAGADKKKFSGDSSWQRQVEAFSGIMSVHYNLKTNRMEVKIWVRDHDANVSTAKFLVKMFGVLQCETGSVITPQHFKRSECRTRKSGHEHIKEESLEAKARQQAKRIERMTAMIERWQVCEGRTVISIDMTQEFYEKNIAPVGHYEYYGKMPVGVSEWWKNISMGGTIKSVYYEARHNAMEILVKIFDHQENVQTAKFLLEMFDTMPGMNGAAVNPKHYENTCCHTREEAFAYVESRNRGWIVEMALEAYRVQEEKDRKKQQAQKKREWRSRQKMVNAA